MTLRRSNLNSGPPPPITKLTVEQDLRLRVVEDSVRNTWDTNKEDIITFLMALQKQNFVLANSLTNLVENWPNEDPIILVHPSKRVPK